MIKKHTLIEQYVERKRSMQEIASALNCSLHKVSYWMDRHGIRRRDISNAVYVKKNPKGDPFIFSPPENVADAILYGLGIGLYWGEGTKANKASVRLGNTDPELVRTFIDFLIRIFKIQRKKLRFSLQVFSDMDPNRALDFWVRQLKMGKNFFTKTTVTKSGRVGTYKKKSQYGVVTVYYHNKKLRDKLVSLLPL